MVAAYPYRAGGQTGQPVVDAGELAAAIVELLFADDPRGQVDGPAPKRGLAGEVYSVAE
jgi:hypothetical protein